MDDEPRAPTPPLELADYDPGWPDLFERLAARAFATVGDVAVAVEHVGSTAVPGLAAKPIVDLDVVVRANDDVSAAIERLERIGYDGEGRDVAVPGLVALGWPADEPRHHLYVVVSGSDVHRDRVAFRDHLRAHADEARRYEQLKRELAAKYRHDWAGYSEAKSAFVAAAIGGP